MTVMPLEWVLGRDNFTLLQSSHKILKFISSKSTPLEDNETVDSNPLHMMLKWFTKE